MKIYILQCLDSLLDYSSLEIYTNKQEAIEAFKYDVSQAKEHGGECYDEDEYSYYYENGESNSKIILEEYTI